VLVVWRKAMTDWETKKEIVPGTEADDTVDEQLDKVLKEMVEKGYLESKEENGKTLYRTTPLGLAYAKAFEQKDSEEKDRN